MSVVPHYAPLLLQVPGAASVPLEVSEQNEAIENQMRNRAQRHADHAATRLRDSGFAVDAHIASGSAAEQLLKEAESGRFDLVAVGSRGMGPFGRTMLGSVSDHVARHCRAALIGRRFAS